MFKPRSPESLWSEASTITVIRLLGSLGFFTLAVLEMNPTYNFIGLGIHWLGDLLDGFWARKFKQETIAGAEFDIIADRIESIFFYINFLVFNPSLFLSIFLYLIDFAVLDFYLSYQFVKYDIISVQYFYKVDKTVFKLNFSKVGKFCNSAVVALILIFLPQFQYVAVAWVAALIGVKGYSIHRLHTRVAASE